MAKRNPALFYLWAHGGGRNYNPMDELDTPILRSLVERSEVVFLEFVSWDLKSTAELERDWNTYIKTGDMPSKLRACISPSNPLEDYLFLAELMSKGRKKLILEKTKKHTMYFTNRLWKEQYKKKRNFYGKHNLIKSSEKKWLQKQFPPFPTQHWLFLVPVIPNCHKKYHYEDPQKYIILTRVIRKAMHMKRRCPCNLE